MTNEKKPLDGITILQLIPSLESGGAERSCIDVTAAIVAQGGKALVATSGGRWVNEIIRAGGEVILLPLKKKNPLLLWQNKKQLEKIIIDRKVDLIHARSRAPAWSGYLAAKNTNIPYMTTFHAAYKFSGKLKKKYNSVMAKGLRVIAISKYIAQHIIDNYNIEPQHIHVIYRGIQTEKFHPDRVHAERMIKLAREWKVPDDKQLILMPSRLTRIKGHHVLIEAMSKMKYRNFFCVICDASPERDRYQQELLQLIKKYDLEDKVRIVDFCADVPAAILLAQLVVAPSLVPEGFGRIPVESQAMGTPVVASAIGGHKEIVVDGETGFLVPPDDADAMAVAMDRVMMMNEEERKQMAENAMRFVHEHFTKEKMTDQTLNVYYEILGSKLNRSF
jgi:glycosyltransferase involved in cell wall biosynthesis